MNDSIVPMTFLIFFSLCWIYLRRPNIAHWVEWYLRVGICAVFSGAATFVTWGAFS